MLFWNKLVRSTPKRTVRVQALAGDIVLSSWARHFTPTVPLSVQMYKWVPANLMLGVTLRWISSHPWGVEILLVASCYRNQDKLRPLDSYVDFTFTFTAGFNKLKNICEDKNWLYLCLLHFSRGRLRAAVPKKRNQWLRHDSWHAKPQSSDSLSVDKKRWYRECRNTTELCCVCGISQRTGFLWL